MDLVERYLKAVAAQLPKETREDIVAELRDDIMGRIEDLEARLGQAPSDDEVEALLRDVGHPLTVAARYRSGPQALMGPELYPWWLFGVKVGLAVMVCVTLVGLAVRVLVGDVYLGQAIGQGFASLFSGAVSIIGILTVAGFILERQEKKPDFIAKWRVKDLGLFELGGNIDADDCAVDFSTACVFRNQFAQKKSSKALYADLTYELGELVTLRGGLRYTWDRGRLSDFKAQAIGIDGVPVANTIPGDPGNFDATTALRFSKGSVTGKVGVDLKLSPDHLLYASYSRGYRGSSFNSQAFFAPDELTIAKPETVDAFEIGAKTQFLDRRLTLNGAVFLYNYKNQQALSLIGVLQPLVNIPKSQIYGAELELVVRPLDVLTLRGGAGYLHTEIRRGNISGADLAGNRLPNAPTWSLNAAADLTILKKGADELSLGINASYNTKQYFDLFNTQRIAQPGYALVNAQASYSFGDGKYKAQIWGKNLFNRTYATSGLDISALGYDYFHLAESRTYGVTVEAKF